MPDSLQTVVFRPRGIPILCAVSACFLLFVSLLAALTIVMRDGPFYGWIAVSVFMGFALYIARGLHPNAYFLSLDRDGFEYVFWFRKYTVRWRNIARIHTVRIGLRNCVSITFIPGYNHNQSPFLVPLANYRDYDFVFPIPFMPTDILSQQLTSYWETAAQLEDSR